MLKEFYYNKTKSMAAFIANQPIKKIIKADQSFHYTFCFLRITSETFHATNSIECLLFPVTVLDT